MGAIPGIWHARRAGRMLGGVLAGVLRRRSPRGVVLLYHRVAGPRRDPQQLDVSPENFDGQIETIARAAAPLALDEFEARRRAGTLPPRAVAVTFDDGYADNLLAAALLERRGVPATVFVTAGMTGADREFWWDDAERIAFSPRRLDPPVPGLAIEWTTADAAPFDDALDDRWSIVQPTTPTARHRLYRAICESMHALETPAREARIHALREWAGVREAARQSHRAMTAAELHAFVARPGMTIGAHTMTHPSLSALTPAAQRDELAGSRATLERELGGAVRAVAYPYGTRADVSDDTVRAARAAGFDFAMANEAGAAWRWSSRWRVPRCLVGNWDAATFAARLESWFAA
jgi:peptidoglycan/xylan/chitin deacetylase (PgdA/CDA1 family)